MNDILVSDAKKIAREILSINDITEINSNINFLLQFALKLNLAEIMTKQFLSKKEYYSFIKLVKKRAKHVPLQHIAKNVDFMDNKIIINKDVLVPRFETEQLTEMAINHINALNLKKVDVLDMCCGSGCIGLGVKRHCESAEVTLADISKKALKVATKNAVNNELSCTFIKSDMFNNIEGVFDVIICNPPYIQRSLKPKLMIEVVKYDPEIALYGGETGLEFYKILALRANKFLKENGALFIEYGEGQEKDIADFLKIHFKDIEIIKDYYGVNRFIKAVKKD